MRLNRRFAGFDSVDSRAGRVPLDLTSEKIRKEYLEKHREWFLANHENVVKDFRDEVTRLYGHNEKERKQLMLLEA